MPKDTQSSTYDWRQAAGKDEPKLGELRRIEIEPAENGFAVEARYAAPKPPKGQKEQMACCGDYERLSKRFVCKDAKEVAELIAKLA